MLTPHELDLWGEYNRYNLEAGIRYISSSTLSRIFDRIFHPNKVKQEKAKEQWIKNRQHKIWRELFG